MAWKFYVTVPTATAKSGKLGSSTSDKYTDTEIGKAVKYSTSDNFVFCADGDDIEGFLFSVSPETVDGFSFGSAVTEGRFEVVVATGSAQCAVGDLVIAGAQVAKGTAGAPKVKKQATPAAGHKYWKVISILSGTGVAGDTILVEFD